MKHLFLGFLLLCTAGSLAAERAIDLETTVKAPVDSVWRVWTTKEGVTSFFAPDANVELKVDGPFEIFFNPFAEPGMKGADGMRILAFQKNTMLAFTWNAPPSLPEARKQRTSVVLRFEPKGDSTVVRLHHSGWGEGGEWDKSFEYFSSAWKTVLNNLQERFTKGPIDWTDWLRQMKELSEKE